MNVIVNSRYQFNDRAVAGAAFKINLRWLNKALICLLAAGFLYYLASNNDLAVKGFVLKDLKLKVSELEKSGQELETQVTVLSSYNNISQRLEKLNLVKVDNINYLPASETMFARK